ncbi:MAG: polar growth protein [Alectoria sarmentosa]|nr:MAG: polar growth protein [Alectoria sarmentosa]
MASRHLSGSTKKDKPGDMLLVAGVYMDIQKTAMSPDSTDVSSTFDDIGISLLVFVLTIVGPDDFEARSPDELSLRKGDRIELIERDDDFGDGWYLGKHIQKGKTGLFPEVYTTTTPKTIQVSATTIATAAKIVAGTAGNIHASGPSQHEGQNQGTTTPSLQGLQEPINSDGATPPPLNTTPPSQRTVSVPNASTGSQAMVAITPAQRSLSMVHQGPDEDSPVMNETLSVIDEHITDMKNPRSRGLTVERRLTNESGSEYSTHIDQRLSYINGHETDEEERNLHTEREVLTWSPSQVAEYLEDIGVEPRHCEVFKEQEISGEILLAMDQSSIFMKEFDLGPVGPRLRTWYKIKALQEEVRGAEVTTQQTITVISSNASSDDLRLQRGGSAAGSTFSTNLFSLPSPGSPYQRHGSPYIRHDGPSPQPSPSPQLLQTQRRDASSTPVSFTFKSGLDSPSRPSAASVREFNHSRRHSAVDFASTVSSATPTILDESSSHNQTNITSLHKKAPSLDRNWAIGGSHPITNGRPRSATSGSLFPRAERNTFDPHATDSGQSHNVSRDLDRGYVSGSEMDGKKARNVLRKRDTISANHSRQSSYHADTKRLSFAGARRHSRFGSVDSIKDTVAALTSPATKLYQNNSFMGHFRNSSANEAIAMRPSTTDISSPTVTKLEYDSKKPITKPNMKIVTSSTDASNGAASNGSPKSVVAPAKSISKPRMGLRAISDAVTGNERALVSTPASVPSPIKETSVQSPTRTGSTSPSAASQSIERESTDASSKDASVAPTRLTPTSGTRRKPKKETSAYIRGLEHKPPKEQMEGCDYSGWMKKRSSNIMTTWKPRLFVLRGRRLSYYYAETDTQEKGLIDISSHRVLPADRDIIAGIHATVTGAKSSPVSPATAQMPTLASEDAATIQSRPPAQKADSDSMFIFKLVPPRTGLSRAVNFTKPTVHYFAVENVAQGRLWMAALMKATIDRDETKPITTTYQQKTISLVKARAMKQRPPALMNLLQERVEGVEDEERIEGAGLNIQGLEQDKERMGSDAPPRPTEEGNDVDEAKEA